jgi:hypothetical protein
MKHTFWRAGDAQIDYRTMPTGREIVRLRDVDAPEPHL